MRDYWAIVQVYVADVLGGNIPACDYVRWACERFARDVARATDVGDIYIDKREGERWCQFAESLPHVKGQWAARKETIELSPWQVFIVCNVYGWKWTENNMRRFREAYVEVGRKNGKSTLLAAVGLGHLCIDNEFGAEVYCGATTEKQAWEVFRPARQMALRSEELRECFGLTVHAKTLTCEATGDRFEPVIGNPGDGASPSAGIADEYHEHKTSDQVDTFVTGMGAREQPIMWYITTAGVDIGGPCYTKRMDCLDILKGTVEDDTVFAVVYTLDEGDDWDTEEAMAKANPNYGISVSKDFLRAQLAQAKRSAIKQSAYRTKHCNQWVGAKAAWMNLLHFQLCRRDIHMEDYRGCRCIAAVDLASKIDVACTAYLFELPVGSQEEFAVFVKHYLPEDVIMEGASTRYKEWHADGWITATPGNVIDYTAIEDDMKEVSKMCEIVEAPFDPFQATQFSTHMLDEGFPMVEVGATVKNFSEPMKEVEKLVRSRRIVFQRDPVLLWMFGNVVAHLDAKDNIYPRKERPESKIDGVVAIIMAMNRAIAAREEGITLTESYNMEV